MKNSSTRKPMRQLFFLLMLFLSMKSFAQNFTGLATYKTDTKIDVKIDSAKINIDQMNMLQQQLRLAMQKEFQLSFNKFESNWEEQEKLDKKGISGKGVEIKIVGIGGGNDGLLYKNTKDKKKLETTDVLGKLFLVSGELKPYKWEMTPETKQIGKYTCYKAIAKREVTERRMSEVNGKIEKKEEKKIRTTIAWYTPEIPVNHGPENYWGLPGLILEVSSGKRIIICTQVILNPKGNKVVIEIPSKGKKVTDEEYEVIMKEQSEKMLKMYGGGKKKGDNLSFSIQIGG